MEALRIFFSALCIRKWEEETLVRRYGKRLGADVEHVGEIVVAIILISAGLNWESVRHSMRNETTLIEVLHKTQYSLVGVQEHQIFMMCLRMKTGMVVSTFLCFHKYY